MNKKPFKKYRKLSALAGVGLIFASLWLGCGTEPATQSIKTPTVADIPQVLTRRVSPDGKLTVAPLFSQEAAEKSGFYAGYLLMPAGHVVSEHSHSSSCETLFLVKGSGSLSNASGVVQMLPADSATLAKGERHRFCAGGNGALFLQFYFPATDGQRFYTFPKSK